MKRLLGTALLFACALGLAPATGAGQVPLENWTHRGGPYHWMGIRPIESRIEREGVGVVRCERTSTSQCASMPVVLMDCKAPEPGADRIPLQGSLHFKALPGEPHALQFLDPGAWVLFWKTKPYYESPVEVTVARSEGPPIRFPATLTRERWAYSTDTAYEVAPLPIREIAEALAEPGNVALSIDGPDILVRATFELDGRTGEFLNVCDPRREMPAGR